MRTADQATWDFVQEWLQKADNDWRAAKILLNEDDYENAAYHAQQACEKYLKAYLIRHQVEFPKTHDIASLLKLISKIDPSLSQSLESADHLTLYGAAYRYPGAGEPLTSIQATEALNTSTQAKETILKALKALLTAGRPK